MRFTTYQLLPTHLIDASCQRRHLQLSNGLRDLDVARAGVGAVVDGVAACQAAGLSDDLHALGGTFVAAVVDEAMSGHKRGGAVVFLAGPERGAGGGAGRTQDALRCVVEAGALLGG